MKRNRKSYSIFQLASAAFMILALLWLTVSIPFVSASQQELVKQGMTSQGSPLSGADEESTNPFGNNTEEKSSTSSSSVSEEYLHEHHVINHLFTIISQFFKGENASTYIAFHGEILIPPPNVA
ncbi:MAG TPA: hypothetical protein VF622_17650 [Segetibacter sp.]|jgi:hypothetical protein